MRTESFKGALLSTLIIASIIAPAISIVSIHSPVSAAPTLYSENIVLGKDTAYNVDLTGDAPWVWYKKGDRPPIMAAKRVGSGAVIAAGTARTCNGGVTYPTLRWKVGEWDVLLDKAFKWMVPGAKKVLWYGKYEVGYNVYNDADRCSWLIDNLRAKGYKVENTGVTPITSSLLAPYDILVIPAMELGDRYTGGNPSLLPDADVKAIKSFVEGGGGLLIMEGSDFAGYNYYRVQNKILRALDMGIYFQMDSVYDDINKWENNYWPVVNVNPRSEIGEAYQDATGKTTITLYAINSLAPPIEIFDDFNYDTIATGYWRYWQSDGGYSISDSKLRLFITSPKFGSSSTIRKSIVPVGNMVISSRVLGSTIYRYSIGWYLSDRYVIFEFADHGFCVTTRILSDGDLGTWGWVGYVAFGQWSGYGGSPANPPPSPNTWYTMSLEVRPTPFTIVASVYDDDHNLLGSLISDLGWEYSDIKEVGLNVWTDSTFNPLSDYFIDWVVVSKSAYMPVPYYSQGDTQWCVPASAAMICRYYGKYIHPWDVANGLLMGHDTPAVPWTPIQLTAYLAGVGLSTNLDFIVNLSTIKTRLDRGEPLILAVTSMHHAVAVIGYKPSINDTILYINDPSGTLLETLYPDRYDSPYCGKEVKWSDLDDYIGFGDWIMGVRGTPSPPMGSINIVGGGTYLDSALHSVSVDHLYPHLGSDVYIWLTGFSLTETLGLSWRNAPNHPKNLDPNDLLSVSGSWPDLIVVNHTGVNQSYRFKITFTKESIQKWSNEYEITVPARSMANPGIESLKLGEILSEYGDYIIRLWLFSSDGTLYDRVELPLIKYLPSLSLSLDSPANLYVTDPRGNCIGADPNTGQEINQISGAVYSGVDTEPQIIIIPDPLIGIYDVKLLGTTTGTYTLNLELAFSSGTIFQTYSGNILQGQILAGTIDVADNDAIFSEPIRVPPSALVNELTMVHHIKLELSWLNVTVGNLEIKQDVKTGLIDKLKNAIKKIDQTINWIELDNEMNANNMLNAARNIMNAFINQVNAQKGKAIVSSDANWLIVNAQNILLDVESAEAIEI